MCPESASSPMRCVLRSRPSSPAATRSRTAPTSPSSSRTGRTCETASARAAAMAAKSGAHRDRGNASAAEWLARAAGTTTGRARSALDTLEAVVACADTRKRCLRASCRSNRRARLHGSLSTKPSCWTPHGGGAARAQGRSTTVPPRVDRSGRPPFATARAAGGSALGRRRLGLVRFTGAFSPEFGKRFANRLDRETDRVWRHARHERRDVTERSAQSMRSSACSAVRPVPKSARPI